MGNLRDNYTLAEIALVGHSVEIKNFFLKVGFELESGIQKNVFGGFDLRFEKEKVVVLLRLFPCDFTDSYQADVNVYARPSGKLLMSFSYSGDSDVSASGIVDMVDFVVRKELL